MSASVPLGNGGARERDTAKVSLHLDTVCILFNQAYPSYVFSFDFCCPASSVSMHNAMLPIYTISLRGLAGD